MSDTWWRDPGQLDFEQRRVLGAAPETDLLIIGPPGSGKTNILMLRANYVRSVAPRLLFLTFTRTLTEFLRSGPNVGRADQIKPDEIVTFMRWGKQFLHDHGHVWDDTGLDFDAKRKAMAAEIAAVVEVQQLGRLYDVVIIDEVQDFLDAELRLLRSLTEHINAAGDARQSIWAHNEGLETMAIFASKTVELRKHYRIGQKICDHADRILPPKATDPTMIEGCNYDEESRPSSVATVACASEREQYATCLATLKQQLRYITDEPILVMAFRKDVRDAFWDALQADGDLAGRAMIQQQDSYKPFGPETLIRVMTIASAKGSEARAVHILNAQELNSGRRELAFTAVTRAKTEVALYHSGPLPGHLEVPTDELPRIDDLFR